MLTKFYAASLYSEARQALSFREKNALLQQCVAQDPTYQPAWFLLLQGVMQKKQYPEAMHIFDKLTALSPVGSHFLITSGNTETWLSLAHWSIQQKKIGRAQALFQLLSAESALPLWQQYTTARVAHLKATLGLAICESALGKDIGALTMANEVMHTFITNPLMAGYLDKSIAQDYREIATRVSRASTLAEEVSLVTRNNLLYVLFDEPSVLISQMPYIQDQIAQVRSILASPLRVEISPSAMNGLTFK